MDITLDRKSDQDISFQYYEADGTTKRSLSGATIYFTVKDNPFDSDSDDSDATIKKDVTSHTTAATGLSTISLTDTDTNISPSNYFYSIRVKEIDDMIYTAQTGRLRVSANTGNRII